MMLDPVAAGCIVSLGAPLWTGSSQGHIGGGRPTGELKVGHVVIGRFAQVCYGRGPGVDAWMKGSCLLENSEVGQGTLLTS